MRDAVIQALQTVGAFVPQPTNGTSAPHPAPAATVGDGHSGSSTQATISIKQDMRQFMHAPFQAVKKEWAAAAANIAATGKAISTQALTAGGSVGWAT